MQRTIQDRPQLLVTILDWGMGHATRTLPLIEHAVEEGWHVHVASKGTALAWLRSHLTQEHVSFHTKPGPEIKYARRGNFLRIVQQVPSFVKHVDRERAWTEDVRVDPRHRGHCVRQLLRVQPSRRAVGAHLSPAPAPDAQMVGRHARAPSSNVGPGRLTRFGFLTWSRVPVR